MESTLIGEVTQKSYEQKWKEAVEDRDALAEKYYIQQEELHKANKLNSELLQKILKSQNEVRQRRKSWLPDWLRPSIKIPLS